MTRDWRGTVLSAASLGPRKPTLRTAWAIAAGLALVHSGALARAEDAAPLERITIREGRFVTESSGMPFTPLGVNYFRLAHDPGKLTHAAFCPGSYEPGYVERMMAHAAGQGLNTVRTFHSSIVGPSGLIETPASTSINPAYLANVVHFLRTAKAHGVRVVFAWDIWLPAAEAWRERRLHERWETRFQPGARPDEGVNSFRFAIGSVRTRAAAIVALIHAIRAVDPMLLQVVLSWELENEVRFAADREPFVSRPRAFRFAGETFDVSTDEGAQALMDATTTAWASACADAIHEADPKALVSASVFTFEAVGRKGPATFSQDSTHDARIPGSPHALLRSHLDFIDIHVYVHRGPVERVGERVEATLASVGFADLLRDARRLGKPILAGEVGISAQAMRRPPPSDEIDHTLGQALVEELVVAVRDAGFAGAVLWHYGNPDSQPADDFPAVWLHPGYGKRLRSAWHR